MVQSPRIRNGRCRLNRFLNLAHALAEETKANSRPRYLKDCRGLVGSASQASLNICGGNVTEKRFRAKAQKEQSAAVVLTPFFAPLREKLFFIDPWVLPS